MEQRLYYSLAKTQNNFRHFFKQVARTRGITASPAQLGILFLLKEKNNSTMSYISNELELDNSAITRSIDRLEKMGFARRTINDKDRREFSIEITSEGLSEIEKARAIIREINASLENKIGKERLELFKEILTELNNIFQSEL